MSTRRKAREAALQALYRLDVSEAASAGEPGLEMDALGQGTDARAYCEAIVAGAAVHRGEIDGLIERFSENWTLDRMAVVDRNVLRIAVYELLFSRDVPYKVVIDEAVELAKRFGSEDSGAFVNGILDRIHRALPFEDPGLARN
jgi:N utilization substance protein B